MEIIMENPLLNESKKAINDMTNSLKRLDLISNNIAKVDDYIKNVQSVLDSVQRLEKSLLFKIEDHKSFLSKNFVSVIKSIDEKNEKLKQENILFQKKNKFNLILSIVILLITLINLYFLFRLSGNL